MASGKFDWSQYDLTSEEKNFSAHTALYWYCSDYNLGQNSWQYQQLSKSPYTPGPMKKSILNEENFAAMDYYNHLVSIFEKNYNPIGSSKFAEGDLQYEDKRWQCVVNVSGFFTNPQELAKEIYSEIVGECLDEYPSVVDVYNCVNDLDYPLSIDLPDEDVDDVYGTFFCFDSVKYLSWKNTTN